MELEDPYKTSTKPTSRLQINDSFQAEDKIHIEFCQILNTYLDSAFPHVFLNFTFKVQINSIINLFVLHTTGQTHLFYIHSLSKTSKAASSSSSQHGLPTRIPQQWQLPRSISRCQPWKHISVVLTTSITSCTTRQLVWTHVVGDFPFPLRRIAGIPKRESDATNATDATAILFI